MRRYIIITLSLLIPLLCVGAIAWYRLGPAISWGGWKLSVAYEAIERVSALALTEDGALLVTQEFTKPNGTLTRISRGDEREIILGGLDKPDGIAVHEGAIYLSQEGGSHPILKLLKSGQVDEIAISASHVEQISLASIDGTMTLYAIEDRKPGALVRYDFSSQKTEVLVDGIIEGEGVSVCPDGSVYYAEKGTGQIKILYPNGHWEVVLDDINRPGFVLCEEEGFWVTEDADFYGKVFFVTHGPPYEKELIASNLRSAQYLLRLSPTSVLIAEQNRKRILLLTK